MKKDLVAWIYYQVVDPWRDKGATPTGEKPLLVAISEDEHAGLDPPTRYFLIKHNSRFNGCASYQLHIETSGCF